MVKKYIKHIVLLSACASMAAVAFCQNVDTTAASATDSAVAQTSADSSTSTAPTEDTAVLGKFLLKEKDYTARERKIAPDDVKKRASADDFWYANKAVPPNEAPTQSGGSWINTFRIVFWWLVAGCFIAILVMYLVNSKVWFFAPKTKRIKVGEVQAEDTEGNIFEMDFDGRIDKALELFDYRLATRLLFLRLLRSLAERNIIKYGIDKTNMDYLFELGNTKYFKDFSTAARNYEYVWYGNFNIQQSQFIHLRQRLEELNRQIKN